MANDSALLTWTANTEPDLAGYHIYLGQYISGAGAVTFTYVTTVGLQTSLSLNGPPFFTNDGRWYFGIDAFDTSGNTSAVSAPINKRIVRTQAYLRRGK